MQFFNTGLYDLNGQGAYPPDNPGLFEFTGRLADQGRVRGPRRAPPARPGLFGFTGRLADQGRFRVPPLRNVALTAPYMHDGSIATLGEVLDHYTAGGRNVTEGPLAGGGRLNPNKD